VIHFRFLIVQGGEGARRRAGVKGRKEEEEEKKEEEEGKGKEKEKEKELGRRKEGKSYFDSSRG